MEKLKQYEIKEVSGGWVQYLVGWAVGETINAGISAGTAHAQQFSTRDHSASNSYYLANRGQFNPLI